MHCLCNSPRLFVYIEQRSVSVKKRVRAGVGNMPAMFLKDVPL